MFIAATCSQNDVYAQSTCFCLFQRFLPCCNVRHFEDRVRTSCFLGRVLRGRGQSEDWRRKVWLKEMAVLKVLLAFPVMWLRVLFEWLGVTPGVHLTDDDSSDCELAVQNARGRRLNLKAGIFFLVCFVLFWGKLGNFPLFKKKKKKKKMFMSTGCSLRQ